jgi:hypothetical protein
VLRYDLAAAFFLLAGALGDALGVLARERHDPQLALLVGRLVLTAPAAAPGGYPASQALSGGSGAKGDDALWALVKQVRCRISRYVVCLGCAVMV